MNDEDNNVLKQLDAAWSAKYNTLQIERDAMYAELLSLKEEMVVPSKGKELQVHETLRPRTQSTIVPRQIREPVVSSDADIQTIYEEHAEYEAIFREVGACTVTETLAQIDGMYARVEECRKTYGSKSWQFTDIVDQIRSMTRWYKCIPKRRPEIARFLKTIPVPCFSYSPPRLTGEPASRLALSSRVRRSEQQSATTVPSMDLQQPARSAPRGRGTRTPRRKTKKQSAGNRGGRFSMSDLDRVIHTGGSSSQPKIPFDEKWFNCGPGSNSSRQ